MNTFFRRLLLTLLPVTLLSLEANAYDAKINGIYYNFSGNEAEVTYEYYYYGGNSDYNGAVVIPASVSYNGLTYSVTAISYSAFSGCSGLTSVTIPNSVTSIGGSAFSSCSGLTSVTIPNSVTSIGNNVFSGCSGLTSIKVETGNTKYDSRNDCNAIIETSSNTLIVGCQNTIIPNSVTSIGNYAFSSCSGLTSVIIPNSVTSIDRYAFSGCSGLTSVTIPNSVTSIGSSTFSGCSGLTSVTIQNSVTTIGEYAFSSCSGLTSVTIGDGVTSIGRYAFYKTGWYNAQPDGILYLDNWLIGYKGTKPTGNVTIKNGTKGIASSAFSGCSGLTSVNIPSSVTSIGESAFDHCSGLTSVTIPISVTSIGSGAFEYCSSLTSVNIPSSVTSIGLDAFAETSWYNNQPDGLVYAGEVAYKYKGNMSAGTEIIIKKGTIGIADRAFYGCYRLTSVTIPNSVTSIGGSAFYGCSGLTSIKVETGNTKYDSRNDCNAIIETSSNTLIVGCQNTIIPNSVTTIGDYAFYNCYRLTSVIIPNSVTSIGNSAFSGCSGLTSVTIGNSLTSIGNNVFSDCRGLTSIKVEEGNTTYDSRNNCNAIIETNSNTLVAGCQNTIIPNSVTTIGNYAFYNCYSLTSIIIPNSVTSIGNFAFKNCSGLTSVTIGNGVTSIGDYAFYWCSGLTSVTIPNSVTKIGAQAFWGCNDLNKVIVPDIAAWCRISFGIDSAVLDGIEELSSNPLNIAHHLYSDEKTEITDLVIPNNVTSIGKYNFYGCSGLTSVTIPNSVTIIGESAFSGCSGLQKVIVPDIAAWCSIAFGSNPLSYAKHLYSDDTTEITNLVIPNSVTSISNSAFNDCSGLTSISIPNSVTSIGEGAFRGCSGLTSIKVETGNTKYDSRNNCNAIIETATNTLIVGCKSTIIPNSVTSIDSYAFYKCRSLTSITIPNSVTSIGDYAFYQCKGLTSVTSEIQEPFATGRIAFLGIPSDATLYVPIGTKTQYQALADWNRFTNIVELEMNSDDLQDYLNTLEDTEDTMAGGIYRREFRNTDWQALYLPFNVNYNDWAESFEVARFNGIDIVEGRPVLSANIMNSGIAIANTPYLIRAKKEGSTSLSVSYSTTNYSVQSVSYSTGDATYTFTGNYEDMTGMYTAQQYRILGGWLAKPTSDSEVLPPFRWYMTINGTQPTEAIRGLKVRINHEGDDATAVDEMVIGKQSNSECFDLLGRKINDVRQAKGIYIINNKKYIK